MRNALKLFLLSLVGIVSLFAGVGANAQYRGGQVTRAELVNMIVDAQNVNPRVSQYNNCFVDVHDENFADEVCYAAARGWLTGFGPEFQPYRVVTAEDAERLVARAFGVESLYVDFDSPAATRSQVRDFIYRTQAYADDYHLTVTSRVVRKPARVARTSTRRVRTVRVPDGYSSPYDSNYYYNYNYYGADYYPATQAEPRYIYGDPSYYYPAY